MSKGEELFGITYEKGAIIFREGDQGNTMYIIQSGAVEISRNKDEQKNVLALLERGDFFGEMALFDHHARAATATAISRSCLLPLTRISLLNRIRHDPGVITHLFKTLCLRITKTSRLVQAVVEGDENLRALIENKRNEQTESPQPPDIDVIVKSGSTQAAGYQESEDLKDLPTREKSLHSSVDVSVNREECVWFEDGEYIFHQGDPGDRLFIVVEGKIEISQGPDNDRYVLAHLGPGEFFGETSIITGQSRTAHASAAGRTLLFPVKLDEFTERIKAEPELGLYILQGLIIRLRMLLMTLNAPEKSIGVIMRNMPPPLRKKNRTSTAIVSLSTCGGCSAVLLEDQAMLTNLLKKINISYCPMLIDAEEIVEVEIAIVDGTVRVKEDEEKLIEARHKAKYLIAWGTCAAFGGIPAYANQYELEELIEESYGHAKDPLAYYMSGSRGIARATYQDQEEELKLLRRARKLDDFVRVDYYLPGCPPNVGLLSRLINELKGEAQSVKTKPIVCAECSRKPQKIPAEHFWVAPRPEWGKDHCFTSRGAICMGFMTKGGCGAVCPRGGLPCWGCRGPSQTAFKKMDEGSSFEEVMLSSLVGRHPHLEDQIKSVMKIYRKHANSSLKFNRYFPSDRSRIR